MAFDISILRRHKRLTAFVSIILVGLFFLTFSYTFPDKSTESKPKGGSEQSATNRVVGWKSQEQAIKDGDVPAPEKILEVTFNYEASQSSKFQSLRATEKKSFPKGPATDKHGYSVRLTSQEKRILYNQPFAIDDTVLNEDRTEDGRLEGKTVVLPKVGVILALPWYDDAKTIEIFDKNGVRVFSSALGEIPISNDHLNVQTINGEDFLNLQKQKDHLLNFDFFTKRAEAADGPSGLREKSYNGKVNILVLANLFDDENEFNQCIDETLMPLLLSYEPFKTRASQIEFHKAYVSIDDCKVDAGGTNNPECMKKMEEKALASGVNFNVWAIVNKGPAGGQGLFGATPRIVSNCLPTTENDRSSFVHEFGHTFGYLLDEYGGDKDATEMEPEIFTNCYKGDGENPLWKGVAKSEEYTKTCSYAKEGVGMHAPAGDSIMADHRPKTVKFHKVALCILNAEMNIIAGKFDGANASNDGCPPLTRWKPGTDDVRLKIGNDPEFECISDQNKCKTTPTPEPTQPAARNDQPSGNCDTTKYAADIQKNPLKKNFGDPKCDFTKDGLYKLLKEADPATADKWFNTIAPCESGYNPNAYAPFSHSPDPAGTWGLFQMGRGLNGPLDHGDVEWKSQAKNAVGYNKKIGGSFRYWGCARQFWK